MNNNIKNKVVVYTFFIFITVFLLLTVFSPSKDISESERRKLAQFPELTINSIMNTEFMRNFEKYSLDQFPFREGFRSVKANVLFNILRQKDNNNIYIVNNQVSKFSETLNEASVKDATRKFNKLYNQYLKNMNVYYSVIPDKNYYIAKENGYPHIDYDRFLDILNKGMENIEYIDLFSVLEKNDYYSTDTHWKQERLDKVLIALGNAMNMEFNHTSNYTENILEPFYGVYYGQSALPLNSEKLIYLTNEVTDNAKVSMLDEESFKMVESNIYDLNKFNGTDSYDIFLSGARPLIIIENNYAETDKELVIFRDSFGSSLSPLLVSAYKKVTVIDLRYIASPLLSQFVQFKDGQDALIINTVDVLNNSGIIKVL